ncbi:ubiquitin carboxyl-terminal hydrolase 14 [Lichtheimia corymbifera JMRC:FSU:9682]|uniref:Ubiquitin carboxyl-terminal hydrolase n=1 Tax=Lichtheimia corymbifera JMRC:FSU:9682 TaxID=1263082 RepID=A0A068RIY7_9FUNG|nr:ubiquitin carboxyl-terminal hydrolase 14 [Lichtheimia corymbifera JMRC:FSU:9682]
MTCTHIETTRFSPPTALTQVYKEECTLCFDSQDGPEGIDVCLTCFNGGCVDPERKHAQLHHDKTGHPLVVNIRRIPIDKPDDGTPPPQKISKLAIVPEEQEQQYEHVLKVRCYACQGAESAKDCTPEISSIVDAVMSSLSSSKQSEVKAWEEEITPCEHTLCLQQDASRKLEQQTLAHCANCDLKENLWLCLTCGNLGCGRRQYDGSGGNNHALEHFEATGHGVSCKLGTITPEGTADIYCYICNDPKLDNDLSTHLANWGINVSQQLKTEKSMTELQLEQNLKFDFSMTTEDGKHLEPKFGPGYTGLKNLGNSCYMASVLQSVFDTKDFQDRYAQQLADHALTCANEPALCWHCQLHKLADGLLSGRYSQPNPRKSEDQVPSQDGIAPSMFKALVGKGHEEFSTMRQQDAFEFFQYLVKQITQKERAAKAMNPTQQFEFEVEQRLQCGKCHKVRYQTDATNSISVSVPARPKSTEAEETLYEPVEIYECLDLFIADEAVEGYNCPSCNEKTTAHKSVKFKTFPEMLVLHARRFAFVDWVPRKLNIEIKFPDGPLQLDKYMSQGQQPGEELLPEEPKASAEPSVDEAAVEQLMAMGFPRNRCMRALINTGNNGAEVAMNWLFEHMEDPGIDDPIEASGDSGAVSEEQINLLCGMGFSAQQAKKALKETNNDPERAVDWLFSHPDETGEEEDSAAAAATGTPGDNNPPFNYSLRSFVSHKGTSVHCGHYVAHVLKNGEWVLFNDNKVAVSPKPPVGEAYVYFLQRTR